MSKRSGGWFRVHRAHCDDPHFDHDGPLTALEAWLWILRNVAYRPVTVYAPQTRGKLQLYAGEFAFALRFLAKAWRWSRTKVERELDLHVKRGRLERRERAGNLVYFVSESETLPETQSETLDTLEICEKQTRSETQSETLPETNIRCEEGRRDSVPSREPDPQGAQALAPNSASPSLPPRIPNAEAQLAEVTRLLARMKAAPHLSADDREEIRFAEIWKRQLECQLERDKGCQT